MSAVNKPFSGAVLFVIHVTPKKHSDRLIWHEKKRENSKSKKAYLFPPAHLCCTGASTL